MANFSLQKVGDWEKASHVLNYLADNLHPAYIAQFREDSDFVLEKMRGHIDAQDLGWAPLSPDTLRLKSGNSTILVETGTLRGSLKVLAITSGSGAQFFIGAASGGHPSGLDVSQLMVFIEYGTSRMPARPLIRPTYEEVQDILKKHWKELLVKLASGGA